MLRSNGRNIIHLYWPLFVPQNYTLIRKMFLTKLSDRSDNFIVRNRKSSCWRLSHYYRLEKLQFSSFDWECIFTSIDHSEGFKNADSDYHTNHMESTWNGIKLRLSSRERIKELITGNLIAFIWRGKMLVDVRRVS